MAWFLYHAPNRKGDEPPFCHECQHEFDINEEVFINIDLGSMLCKECYYDHS